MSHLDCSFEYPHHMFWLEKKKLKYKILQQNNQQVEYFNQQNRMNMNRTHRSMH